MSERTVILIKPDDVRRRRIGAVISGPGNRSFFGRLLEFTHSTPLTPLVTEGPRASGGLAGKARPSAAPGTIRGGHALQVTENAGHKPDSAGREIKIFFPELV